MLVVLALKNKMLVVLALKNKMLVVLVLKRDPNACNACNACRLFMFFSASVISRQAPPKMTKNMADLRGFCPLYKINKHRQALQAFLLPIHVDGLVIPSSLELVNGRGPLIW